MSQEIHCPYLVYLCQSGSDIASNFSRPCIYWAFPLLFIAVWASNPIPFFLNVLVIFPVFLRVNLYLSASATALIWGFHEFRERQSPSVIAVAVFLFGMALFLLDSLLNSWFGNF